MDIYNRIVFEDYEGRTIIETKDGYYISGNVPEYVSGSLYDNFNDALDVLLEL